MSQRIIVIVLVLFLVYWTLMSKSGYVVSYPPEDMSDRYRWAGDAMSVIQHPWAPN
jgi:Trk-type K+ transport system membrane component